MKIQQLLVCKKKKLWFAPNNNLVLLETLKFPLLSTVHALNHWSTEKIVAFMDQYQWGNISKATKSAYFTYSTCSKYDRRKPVCTVPGHFKLPHGPFEVWQMDFILPLPHGYKCFSHGTYVFSLDQRFPL